MRVDQIATELQRHPELDWWLQTSEVWFLKPHLSTVALKQVRDEPPGNLQTTTEAVKVETKKKHKCLLTQ